MKQEIGGYLELEVFHGKEYYPDLVKVNLGRTALCWLLESRKIETLYLPFFLCDSVIDACERQGTHVIFYPLDKDLAPVLPPDLSLHTGEYLYLVNYYGQLTDEKILYYKKHYKNIIVDHTHAFYQRPLPGVDTLYSCRKFFGLSDGAYLSTDATLTAEKEQDVSAKRMGHILGRCRNVLSENVRQRSDLSPDGDPHNVPPDAEPVKSDRLRTDPSETK